MPHENPEFMQRARRARDSLIQSLIVDPDVVLIDIGLPPETDSSTANDDIVVRVHVRKQWSISRPEERLDIPREIDGIRVVVIPGDYHPE